MALVNVCTPSRFTLPKSASASISASATPPRIAGRAIGTATRSTARSGVRPSPRAASTSSAPWLRKALRASRYTYGYSVSVKTTTAPPAERSGSHVSPRSSRAPRANSVNT